MKIVHLSEIAGISTDIPLFTAPVSVQSPFAEGESKYNISYVHFPDGVRNKLHTHTNDQILIVTEGHGKVASEEKEIEIKVGDIILIPAGEKHWHGAIAGSAMTHISILQAGTKLDLVED